jgi:hypothetical protein
VAGQAPLLAIEFVLDGGDVRGAAAHLRVVAARRRFAQRVQRRFADLLQTCRRRLAFVELVVAQLLDETLDSLVVGVGDSRGEREHQRKQGQPVRYSGGHGQSLDTSDGDRSGLGTQMQARCQSCGRCPLLGADQRGWSLRALANRSHRAGKDG